MQLQGCYTAIVTPFRNDQVDYEAFAKLIDAQLAGGVDGLVPVGTTGESPTVNFDEHMKIIDFVLEKVGKRCPVIVGSGGNSTAEAIELTKHAAAAGADASLQVTPYYNKPTPEGLYRHFLTVAEAGGIPIVLYNVPGRSACEIPVDVVARLAPHPLVAAVKEAGGSVDRVSAIRSVCDITVLSGDDMLTLPMMSLGAKGVISVGSNVLPEPITRMTHAALAGDWETARELHFRLYPFFCSLFVETNPIPVKAALAMLGRIAEEYRLPMCPITDASRTKLLEGMRAAGIAV